MKQEDNPTTVTFRDKRREIWSLEDLDREIEECRGGNPIPNEIVLHENQLFDNVLAWIGREFAGIDDEGAFVVWRSIKLRPPRACEDAREIWVWER